MPVSLIAMGGGTLSACTQEAAAALYGAEVLFGASRLIRDLPEDISGEKIPEYKPSVLAERIREIAGAAPEKEIAVLYSGDTGFYSGARLLLPQLEEAGIPVTVLPGVSSIQILSARLGKPWQDWNLISAHGLDADPVASVMTGRPSCFLTGGKIGPDALCKILTEAGLGNAKAAVGSDLTLEGETVVEGTVEEIASLSFPTLSVLWVDAVPVYPQHAPGLPDDAFLRGEVPMSKRPVRTAVLSELEVAPSDVIWDVGAGTGGVSIELALAARQGKVYAVERKPEGVALLRKNRRKFLAWNLTVLEGSAPEALRDLPAPDKVFIGGSGGNLREILTEVLRKNPQAKICADAVTMETLTEAWTAMNELGLSPSVLQISAAQTKELGTFHLLFGNNPAFLLTGQKEAADA